MTPAGAAVARAELADLIETNEAAPQIRALEHRIERMIVVPAPARDRDAVQFGAHVRIRHETGRERDVRIVGIDEVNPARGDVSYRSPMAKALFGARAGDSVILSSPRADEEIDVLAVSYDHPTRESDH